MKILKALIVSTFSLSVILLLVSCGGTNLEVKTTTFVDEAGPDTETVEAPSKVYVAPSGDVVEVPYTRSVEPTLIEKFEKDLSKKLDRTLLEAFTNIKISFLDEDAKPTTLNPDIINVKLMLRDGKKAKAFNYTLKLKKGQEFIGDSAVETFLNKYYVFLNLKCITKDCSKVKIYISKRSTDAKKSKTKTEYLGVVYNRFNIRLKVVKNRETYTSKTLNDLIDRNPKLTPYRQDTLVTFGPSFSRVTIPQDEKDPTKNLSFEVDLVETNKSIHPAIKEVVNSKNDQEVSGSLMGNSESDTIIVDLKQDTQEVRLIIEEIKKEPSVSSNVEALLNYDNAIIKPDLTNKVIAEQSLQLHSYIETALQDDVDLQNFVNYYEHGTPFVSICEKYNTKKKKKAVTTPSSPNKKGLPTYLSYVQPALKYFYKASNQHGISPEVFNIFPAESQFFGPGYPVQDNLTRISSATGVYQITDTPGTGIYNQLGLNHDSLVIYTRPKDSVTKLFNPSNPVDVRNFVIPGAHMAAHHLKDLLVNTVNGRMELLPYAYHTGDPNTDKLTIELKEKLIDKNQIFKFPTYLKQIKKNKMGHCDRIEYTYKFLAISHIAKNPGEYGIVVKKPTEKIPTEILGPELSEFK